MAFGGMKFNLSMLIASLTITIGAFLPSAVMAIIITVVGLAGTFVYFVITPGLNDREKVASLRETG